MEQLLEQVPELMKKLRKRSEIRTTHYKDVQDDPTAKVGEVVTYVSWVDETGHQWKRWEVLNYIKLQEIIDSAKVPVAKVPVTDMEVEYAN